MQTRKYATVVEAVLVAREAVWLAWLAAGGPQGMGWLQNKSSATKEEVWNQAYEQHDYRLRHGTESDVNADYVFGRMLKLYFKVTDEGALEVPDGTPRYDYQSWCSKYPTYAELFDAAENAVKQVVNSNG